MAATERLSDSAKRQRRQGIQKMQASGIHYRCNGQHDINVNEELEKLQPSERLLDYYREKIVKFDKENQEMMDLIEKYSQLSRPTLNDNERKQMVRELIELRSALSDVNVFIHAERQQVLRLHAEKEQLQLDNLEAEKKATMLLSLSGLTDGELKVFLRDPKRVALVKQKLPPHLRKLQKKLDEEQPKSDGSENERMLQSRVNSLEKQLKDAEANWLDEKTALLQERTLASSEYKIQREKDEANLKLLAVRLEETQRHLKDAMKQSVNKNAEMQEVEKGFLAERDHLLSVLGTVKENMPLVTHMEDVQRSGSYTDLTKLKSTCELRDLRRDNEILKRELGEAEELKTLYESQCLKLEQMMCKLREQKEASEQIFKERNQKLLQQTEMLERENKRIDERRKSDLKGFQSDIQMLRSDVKTLVSQIYKITVNLYGDGHAPVDVESLNEMQAVSALVRGVQRTLGDAKRKILRVEAEIAHGSPD